MAKTATVSYSPDHKEIEVVVPQGTKSADLPQLLSVVISKAVLSGLGRPCTTCHSGDHFLVREALASVINVDLD
jgi:hypothetical protein